MAPLRIAYLEISTFAGIVGWAEHYFGTIIFDTVRIELERPLTAFEASQRNAADNGALGGGFLWHAGDLTTSFANEGDVKLAAIRAFRVAPELAMSDVLLHGSRSYRDPQPVLAWRPEASTEVLTRVGSMQAAVAIAEEIAYWESDKATMQRVAAQWDRAVKGAD